MLSESYIPYLYPEAHLITMPYSFFPEDAKPVHGNPLKYMGKARPVCQAYQDEPELGRNLFCHSCRHQCPQREYMVKYVGRFEPQEAQPQKIGRAHV